MASRKPSAPPKGAEKILQCGIERDPERFLYYVDKRCNVVRMERGVPRARTEILLETGLKREKGFMYFIDDDGDLARAPDSGK